MLRLGVTSTGKAFFALVLIVVSVSFYAFNCNPTILRTPPAPDIEVVMSSYREDPLAISLQINRLRQLLEAHGWSSRVTLYSKDDSPGFNQTKTMQEVGANELVMLRNRGREGGTFLRHIITQYDVSKGSRHQLSRHILFAQSLLEYKDLLPSRIAALRTDTAFISLGRYATCDCGRDAHGQKPYFPRMREIYSMFTGELCPGGGQLCTYKGQFIVSRRQILSNPKQRYQHLLDILEAPEGHWIYDDREDRQWMYDGQKSSPSSPYFGHVLERSWPTIFGCTNASIADDLSQDKPELCQCLHA